MNIFCSVIKMRKKRGEKQIVVSQCCIVGAGLVVEWRTVKKKSAPHSFCWSLNLYHQNIIINSMLWRACDVFLWTNDSSTHTRNNWPHRQGGMIVVDRYLNRSLHHQHHVSGAERGRVHRIVRERGENWKKHRAVEQIWWWVSSREEGVCVWREMMNKYWHIVWTINKQENGCWLSGETCKMVMVEGVFAFSLSSAPATVFLAHPWKLSKITLMFYNQPNPYPPSDAFKL
jgi:hypothetical protein